MRLLSAGDGVQRGLLENWIAASRLDAVVELLGHKLRDYLRARGRVLCEAYASCLPVVATASGNLASKIEILWRDRELGQMLGRQGKARSEKCFDWTVIFAKLVSKRGPLRK